MTHFPRRSANSWWQTETFGFRSLYIGNAGGMKVAQFVELSVLMVMIMTTLSHLIASSVFIYYPILVVNLCCRIVSSMDFFITLLSMILYGCIYHNGPNTEA